jgi:hypothetical protein
MNMKAKPQLEQSMQEEQIRTAMNTHWQGSAAGDANAEHDIYDDERICGRPFNSTAIGEASKKERRSVCGTAPRKRRTWQML